MTDTLYYSLNIRHSLRKSIINGFNTEIISNIAVHLTNENVLVIGGENSLFISEKLGGKSQRLTGAEMIL